MSFSARSASPTASLVAAAELCADATGDEEGLELEAVTSLFCTEALTMRSVPPTTPAGAIDAAAAAEVAGAALGAAVEPALGVAVGAGVAPTLDVGVGVVAGLGEDDGVAVEEDAADAVADTAGEDAGADDAALALALALALGEGLAAMRALPALPTA